MMSPSPRSSLSSKDSHPKGPLSSLNQTTDSQVATLRWFLSLDEPQDCFSHRFPITNLENSQSNLLFSLVTDQTLRLPITLLGSMRALLYEPKEGQPIILRSGEPGAAGWGHLFIEPELLNEDLKTKTNGDDSFGMPQSATSRVQLVVKATRHWGEGSYNFKISKKGAFHSDPTETTPTN